MAAHAPSLVRAVALAGPTGAGKTTLMEAMLTAAGGKAQRTGGGGTVGDATPEARARGHSVELNVAGFDHMGDRYVLIDCPGAVDFAAEGDLALPAVDLVIVVAEPDPAKAILLQPLLRELERLGVPRLLFINKMDQARAPSAELLSALGAVSAAPVVAQQLPTWTGDHVTGVIDLPLERGYAYRNGGGPETFAPADEVLVDEQDARFHMLEQLADFDDVLLEKLVSDEAPETDLVFADLVRELNEGVIVPVLFGAAAEGFAVERLLKAIRHDTGSPQATAERFGLEGPGAYVIKTTYAGQAGKLALARVLGGPLADGAEVILPDGEKSRAGGLFAIQGGALKKIDQAQAGDVIAIGKIDHSRAGQFLSFNGKARAVSCGVAARPPVYGWAISAKVRNDDVRLSGALAKLIEEDPALSLSQEAQTHQTLLSGQSEAHLRLTLERLKRRFGVEVATASPATPYQETITGRVSHHARHKKQTGGHGQFGDVTIEIGPLPRGSGFAFSQRITGGVVPKQWIPAVEQGVRDAMEKGPLGFPVVDVAVTLTDGGYHSVDSSEMAFRQAGRLAMDEGLRRCGAALLEPIERLEFHVPSTCTSSVTSLLSARRGQVLGFGPREGWPGWDVVEAYLPRAERYDLIGELRSLSQGLGSFEFSFDHMAEVNGRLAEEVVQRQRGEKRASG
ncbi:MAG TPA: elongation factor G [Caulobacteraceae bacterium]|nr:elongation factor G [Caulobacteraceae bacterium]